MLIPRVAPLVALLVIAVLRTAASASDEYAQFCSSAKSATEEQVKAFQDAERTSFPLQLADALILERARDALSAANQDLTAKELTSVSIAVRDFSNIAHGPPRPDEGILFRVDRDKGVVHVLVTFDPTGEVKTLRLATTIEVGSALEFGRFMSSYMLFNDLTASDAEFPRTGCASAFREQNYPIPEIIPELLEAIRAQPTQDPLLLARVHQAFDTSVSEAGALKGDDAVILHRTLHAIGPSPTITVVYRDRDTILNSPVEFDVVRLEGRKRAYAMFSVDPNGKSALGPMPICVVGDTSCVRFYAWP